MINETAPLFAVRVEPVVIRKTCHGCEAFGIHDMHYFYCANQDAPNKHENADGYYYPWFGAGKQLRDDKPNDSCPYNAGNHGPA